MLLDVLSFDVVVEICEYLSSRDQGQMAKASRLVLLIATQAGRRATLVVGAGPRATIAGELVAKLSSPPTLGVLFASDATMASRDTRAFLETRLPPGLKLIGSVTRELQCIPSTSAAVSSLYAAPHVGELGDDISLMLGSFPDAETCVFHAINSLIPADIAFGQ